MRCFRSMLGVALLLAAIGCAITAGAEAAPSVLPLDIFLRHAQRQAETDDQRREVRKVLADLLLKAPVRLKRERYADYSGRSEAWTAPELLSHYFISDPPGVLDTHSFFRDVTRPRARQAVRQQLSSVEAALRRGGETD